MIEVIDSISNLTTFTFDYVTIRAKDGIIELSLYNVVGYEFKYLNVYNLCKGVPLKYIDPSATYYVKGVRGLNSTIMFHVHPNCTEEEFKLINKRQLT